MVTVASSLRDSIRFVGGAKVRDSADGRFNWAFMSWKPQTPHAHTDAEPTGPCLAVLGRHFFDISTWQ